MVYADLLSPLTHFVMKTPLKELGRNWLLALKELAV